MGGEIKVASGEFRHDEYQRGRSTLKKEASPAASKSKAPLRKIVHYNGPKRTKSEMTSVAANNSVRGGNIREIAKYVPAFEPVSLREPSEKEKDIDATLNGIDIYLW